jgi:type II secretory pathway pseudopilin PulG
MKYKYNDGISFLEILIVVGIIAIISAVASAFLADYGKGVEIEVTKNRIISDLKQAQTKSMTGDSGLFWGVYFVNATSGYYRVYSTPTTYASASTTIQDTVYLPGRVSFSVPSSTPVDVLFQKIRGTINATSTIVLVSSSTPSSTVIIVPSGLIY